MIGKPYLLWAMIGIASPTERKLSSDIKQEQSRLYRVHKKEADPYDLWVDYNERYVRVITNYADRTAGFESGWVEDNSWTYKQNGRLLFTQNTDIIKFPRSDPDDGHYTEVFVTNLIKIRPNQSSKKYRSFIKLVVYEHAFPFLEVLDETLRYYKQVNGYRVSIWIHNVNTAEEIYPIDFYPPFEYADFVIHSTTKKKKEKEIIYFVNGKNVLCKAEKSQLGSKSAWLPGDFSNHVYDSMQSMRQRRQKISLSQYIDWIGVGVNCRSIRESQRL